MLVTFLEQAWFAAIFQSFASSLLLCTLMNTSILIPTAVPVDCSFRLMV